jgi:hypothetical protein
MLYAFAFDRLGVVVSDLYFLDPNPMPGQEGAEQGVRLEVRLFERPELRGSIYSAQPIAVERPIWRADLLESVDNPGSLDRAHHHPRFRGWEPGRRHFVPELSADPVGWVESRLRDPKGLFDEAGVSLDEVPTSDVDDLRRSAPEISAAVQRLLERVRGGELARPPDAAVGSANGEQSGVVRSSWL